LVVVFLKLRKTFEIIHLHGFTRKSIPLVWLGRLTGKRIVYKMTSLGADDVVAVGQGPLASRALRRIDRFISVSPGLSERYRQAGLPPAKLTFIPNGVDTVRFHPVDPAERPRLRASVGLPSDAPVIAFVGFFSRDKAPQVLVQAWCRIRKEVVPSPTLLLIGSADPAHVEVDPRIVAEVRDLIRAERAESFVRFVGTTHDIPTFLQASDIFALPSLREGLPNALMEAMACGLACLASRLPGVTDLLIENGVNGHLLHPGDCDDLAAALLALLRDPSRRAALGARAQATIEQRFSIDHTASLTEQLYHQLSINR
jgi:glycosyltransferase involved in cell wall biosynthesis